MIYIKIFLYNLIKFFWFIDTMILPFVILSFFVSLLFYVMGVSSWEESFKGINWYFFVGMIIYFLLSTYIMIAIDEPHTGKLTER